jgi:hypothetical protein
VAAWASPVSVPADEVLGRGCKPGSFQKATTAPAMARAVGMECYAMNAIQSARVWRVRFGLDQAAGIRWPDAVQPGQSWYIAQYLNGHSIQSIALPRINWRGPGTGATLASRSNFSDVGFPVVPLIGP